MGSVLALPLGACIAVPVCCALFSFLVLQLRGAAVYRPGLFRIVASTVAPCSIGAAALSLQNNPLRLEAHLDALAVGGFLGLLLSMLVAPLWGFSWIQRERCCVADADHAWLRAGAWLLGMAGGQAALQSPLRGLTLGTAAFGIAFLLVAAARFVGRAHWMSQVKHGCVPGWRLSPLDGTSLPLRAFSDPCMAGRVGVLGALVEVGRGPYRSAIGVEPVMLADLDPSRTRWRRTGHAAGLCVATAAFTLATTIFVGVCTQLLLRPPSTCTSTRDVARIRGNELRSAASYWLAKHPSMGCPSTEQLAEDGVIDSMSNLRDPWSRAYRIACEVDDVRVTSAGSDGSFDTSDDITASDLGR